MIQRIQTIYFLLILLLIGVLMITDPVYFSMSGYDKWTNDALGTLNVSYLYMTYLISGVQTDATYNSYLIYSLVVTAITAFCCIFLYGNRKRQILLARINFISILAVIGTVMLYYVETHKWISDVETMKAYWVIGLPVLLPVLNILAIRGIKKDAALIRSMDRLR